MKIYKNIKNIGKPKKILNKYKKQYICEINKINNESNQKIIESETKARILLIVDFIFDLFC